MTKFRELENQTDNEIIALAHAGLNGYSDAWQELLQRDKAVFTALAAETDTLDLYSFADLQSE